MLLAIDCGNTQTTVGMLDDAGTIVHQWRMATNTTDTKDQLHSRLHSYFAMFGRNLSEVTHVAIASVVPALSQEWQAMMHSVLNTEPLMIDAKLDCGLCIALDNPYELGADRIANAMAAKARYGSPVIVVDFGTATNIDVVDADGTFVGGAIMPGLMLSAQALFSRAAKLSSVPLIAPQHALGSNTETAVQSGLIVGSAAMAEGLVERIQTELLERNPSAPRAVVVATGGLAKTVAQATNIFDYVDGNLTIYGIYQIWKQQQP
ncbi:type III pantothenate kinase [Atopobium fossor]|uniref:type III pantothenate kinase n=1 Tax=Atopobium fossor TaxID=39487 RepID=UPI0004089973|nr:type III pantothenate kinase [Atopobium fossor]